MRPIYWDGDSRPLRLPCFRIWAPSSGKHPLQAAPVEGTATGHDNEARLPHLCAWLQRRVLPHVAPEARADVCGYYRIELHDSYAYLKTPEATAATRYRDADCLTFSGDRSDVRSRVALMPDPYQVDDYGGMLTGAARDSVPWERKTEGRVLFAGSTTGDRDPSLNERVRARLWSVSRAAYTDFRLTAVVQMDAARLLAHLGPQCPLHAPMSFEEQFRYRYIANIAGNTCCWSRVPMLLSSNSLMLNVPHLGMTWYHLLLQAGEHFVEAPLHRLAQVHQACISDEPRSRRIVASANRFALTYLNSTHAAVYTRALLEAMEE